MMRRLSAGVHQGQRLQDFARSIPIPSVNVGFHHAASLTLSPNTSLLQLRPLDHSLNFMRNLSVSNPEHERFPESEARPGVPPAVPVQRKHWVV